MSKRTIYLSALCATLTALSFTPAASADNMMGDMGFTLGVDYGRTEAKKYCDHITNCSDADKGPKIEVGYNFNKYWAAELGYTRFGTLFDSTDNAYTLRSKSNAITLSAIGSLPLSEYFDIYGRLGFARYDTKNSGQIDGVTVKNENGNSPFWGAGVKFKLNEQFSLRLEYQDYSNLSDQPGRKDDVQGLFGGVNYRF